MCTAHVITYMNMHNTHVFLGLLTDCPKEIHRAPLKINLMHISFQVPNLLLLNQRFNYHYSY